MTQRDFYRTLGIERDASPTDIRAAFVRLAKYYHPDHVDGTGNLPQRLHDVQQAYRCLSDPDARVRHDRAIAEAERAHFARQHGIQRRLRRYDQRDPRSEPHPPHWGHWRALLLVTIGTAIIVQVSYGLMA